jgi:hypothetical protein
VVGSGHNKTVGIVLLEKLEERVQDSPNFADVVLSATLATKGVELVEEVHAAGQLERVELAIRSFAAGGASSMVAFEGAGAAARRPACRR